MTEPIVVVVAPAESEVEPELEVIAPVVEIDDSELVSLREYKTRREAEDTAVAQATADEALRVAQLAVDLALLEPEVIVEPEVEMEIEPDIAPVADEPPTNDHAFFKNW